MLIFANSQSHTTLISADGSRWPLLLWESEVKREKERERDRQTERERERERERESFDENEFVVGRDATRCVALRRNNLFDDFSVWWLQQVRPTAAVLSPAFSQTILPPTATPRFAFNKWPNHSPRGDDLSKNQNFCARCRLTSHRLIYQNEMEFLAVAAIWHVTIATCDSLGVPRRIIDVAVEIAILYSLFLQ